LEAAVEALLDLDAIVVDRLSKDATELEVCDAENLERLLRIARAAARPVFEPLPAAKLPLFLATHQRLAMGDEEGREEGKTRARDRLQAALEPLLGYPLPAALLEAEILPARLRRYEPAVLDDIATDSELGWFGCGPKRIALGLAEHRDLIRERDAATRVTKLPDPFPAGGGKYAFADLLQQTGLHSAELADRLWALVWKGRVANDTFAALRKGVQTGFRASERGNARRGRRLGFNRWRATRPFAGNWYAVPPPEPPVDVLDRLERDKERVRILLDRYGIVCRVLLQHELPPFRWQAVFRTLRLMELAGEVLAGSFFEDVPYPQFMAPSAFRRLEAGLPDDAVFWLNAADPASLCGVPLDALRDGLPRRLPSNHIVYHGERPVLISEGSGRRLDVRVSPDDPSLGRYLCLFDDLLARRVQPLNAIAVETVNGQSVRHSPYLAVLRARFDVTVTPRKATVRRRT